MPFMMRVEVETDLKLLIPPPMLSIPPRPPREEEKEVNSTEEGQMIRRGQEKRLINLLRCHDRNSVSAKIIALRRCAKESVNLSW